MQECRAAALGGTARQATLISPSRMLPLIQRFFAFCSPGRCMASAIGFFLLMVGIGAVPGNAQTLSSAVHDKTLHFLAYALLSLLLYRGFSGGKTSMRSMKTIAAIGVLGAVDEAIQSLLPYREASLADWRIDVMAALVCMGLLALLTLLRPLPSLRSAHAAYSDTTPIPPMQADPKQADDQRVPTSTAPVRLKARQPVPQQRQRS